jgi:hypothetical protein
MTVHELIEELKQHDPNKKVQIDIDPDGDGTFHYDIDGVENWYNRVGLTFTEEE